VNKLKEVIEEEVKAKGFVTFDRFVELCLYHEELGYYRRRKPGEDFFTAPELTPIFGKVLSHHILKVSRTHRIPLNILELGGGRGILAMDIAGSLPVESYTLLELADIKSPFKGVRVARSLEEVEPFSGFVVSNEFFDAFPFKRLVKREGKLFEVVIRLEEGRLQESLVEFKGSLPCQPKENGEYSLFVGWQSFLSRLFDVFEEGYFITFDYGGTCAELRSGGRTFRAYRKHRLEQAYLEHLGSADLTSSVDFDYLLQLLSPHLCTLKCTYLSEFLLSEGIERFATGRDLPGVLTLLVDMGRKFKVLTGFKV